MSGQFDEDFFRAEAAKAAGGIAEKVVQNEKFAREMAALGLHFRTMASWEEPLPLAPVMGLGEFLVVQSDGRGGAHYVSPFGREVFPLLGLVPGKMSVQTDGAGAAEEGDQPGEAAEGGNADGAGADAAVAEATEGNKPPEA